MADKGLQDRVIKLLNAKPKKRETLAKIVQTLRVPKKSLNNQLYRLQGQGRIVKFQESPPVWALQEGAPNALTPRATRSTQKKNSYSRIAKFQGDEQLEANILEFLSGKQKPSKALEIAKATGHSRAHDVNTTLYSMLKKRLIKKLTEKPPTWVIAAGNIRGTQGAIEGASGIKLEPNPDSSASGSFPTTEAGVPVFQDTVLFNTEIKDETESYSSEAFTNEDDETDESYNDGLNSRVVSDRRTGEFRRDSPVLAASGTDSDISTQGTYKLFKRTGDFNMSDNSSNKLTGDDSGEFGESKATQDNNGTEEDMDTYISSSNSGSCNNAQSDTVTEPLERGAKNELVKNPLFHQRPEFDSDNVKKPRTFRDVFQLDEPMSDDTSSSFDSAEDIEDELEVDGESSNSQDVKEFAECNSGTDNSLTSRDRQSTPDVSIVTAGKVTPEQKVERVWDTPHILDAVLDLQEGAVDDTGESNDVDAFGDERLMSVESENVFQNEMKAQGKRQCENNVGSSHCLEAKDEISQVEMDKDISGNQSDQNDESREMIETETESGNDMEDCDKVLKVLRELKGIAQFVLKRKTDISPENLDEVLQKCLSLNYVSGSSKLWKITDEGMNYISQKTGTVNKTNESEMFLQPKQKSKPVFKGPPPSPKALLGKTDTGFSDNTTGPERNSKSNRTVQFSTLTSHSPDSLFKPPPAHGGSVSSLTQMGGHSVVKNEGLVRSNSEPKPLMSLRFDSNSSVSKTQYTVPQNSNSLNQSSVRQETIQPLMSLQFEQNPMEKNSMEFSHQSSNQTLPRFGEPRLSSDETCVVNSREGVARTSSQNQQKLNSDLWGTGAYSGTNSGGSVGFNVIAKTQDSNFRSPISQLLKSSGQASSLQAGSQKPVFGSQNSMNQTPRILSPQNIGKTAPLQGTREIPSKYADYPNQSTSLQCLKSKTQSTSVNSSASTSPSNSAFNKGPPPSPLDILSKNLKKTEISPPSSYKDKISVSYPSDSFSTMSVTYKSTESKTVFPGGQFSQTGSQSYSSGFGNRMEQTLNQSGIIQPSVLKGSSFSQSKQSGFQNMSASVISTTANQSGSFGSSAPQTFSRGPPPPPAVKLGLQPAQSFLAQVTVTQPALAPAKPNLSLALNTESFNALNKNPVSALMEYAQSRKMTARVEVISRRGSSHKPTFEMAAFVGDRKFPSVTCHNKKEGRKEACDIAMRQLVAEGQFQAEAGNSSGIPPVPAANMTHFDTIAALTHRGFTALVSQITTESFAGRKVIAGLVMKRSEDDTGVLVSLGTGNRCITGQQLSLQGNTVNDSHAEIVTRRGFLRFLYKQLLDYNPGRPHPMFEKSSSGKLQLRPNITFHLYISTAPCGDGALFSPRDAEATKASVDMRIRPPHEPIFTSNVQGLLRTKVEGGEGTIPVEPGFKGQTFDGIQRGERLRTMSCTDKICRWNVVGMQGALLSHFLEPIYLDSLTLGLLYDHGHLARAVCCRVGRGQVDVNTELPYGFKLNHPWLGRVTVCDPPREVQKTKALSVNWCFGDNGPEVTDGTQGLCYTSIEKGFFSRCSKRNLFMSFKSLCQKLGRDDLLQVSSYNEAKVTAQNFVQAKEVMLRRFKENGFGKWVSKPVEEEMFGFDEQ